VIVTCLVAAGFEHLPWLKPAVNFIARSQREDGSWPIDRDLETFDTDLAIFAFRETGGEVPNTDAVREWLLSQQVDEVCFATSAPGGGWAWAKPSGWPDTDDTAYTLLALRQLGVSGDTTSLKRGAEWLCWMQDTQGSWSTFVRGSKMPFDHDDPYVTGHALSALHAVGYLDRTPDLLERALGYLRRAQRADGSFASIWFREATAGTASALQALCDVGLAQSPMAVRARDALLHNQNDDGGWGGKRGQPSTAEETAWAVLALLASGDPPQPPGVHRGLDWLIAHQQPDGGWRVWPIGLYYSAMWYSDSMYALALPTQALARAAGQGFPQCGSP
jgi:squalene-hopene/tetraprenyl-beta-curcumene cyclase